MEEIDRKTAIRVLKWAAKQPKITIMHQLEKLCALEEEVIPFESIWEIYSKVNRAEKKKAKEKWDKMSNQKKQKALSGVNSFLQHKPFSDYQHPALIRYLRNERWDEVEEEVISEQKATLTTAQQLFR